MLIGRSKYHRTVDGTELVKAREGLFLSQAAFAALCGWSRTYQGMLEKPGEHEIPTNTACKIMEVVNYSEDK